MGTRRIAFIFATVGLMLLGTLSQPAASAVVTFRAAATAGNNGTTNNLVIPKPAGTVDGDFLLAGITVRDNPVITAPTGWTLVRKDPIVGVTLTQAIYYHFAGSADPGPYTWTFTSTQFASGGISAYSGVDTTVPINASNGASGSGMSLTAPSVVTTVSDALIVGVFGIARTTNITAPTGMTERFQVQAMGGGGAEARTTTEASDVTQSTPGPSGNKTATTPQAAAWVAQLVALKPKDARATTTGLSCPTPTTVNTPVICTVTVTDAATGTKSPPTGTVSFVFTAQPTGSTPTLLPNPCVLAPSGLTASTCTTTFTGNVAGTYTIRADYVPGAGSLHTASNGSATISVTARATSTTVSCPTETPANTATTCKVTVADATATGTASPPAGTVDLTITGPSGAHASATPDPCTLAPDATTPATNDSACTTMFTADTIGSYTIRGTYLPAPASVHAGSFGEDTILVTARATTTTVDCPDSTNVNSPVTCTVTVTDSPDGTATPPQGTVDFAYTSTPSGGTAVISPDPCTLTTSGAATSTCTITFTGAAVASYTITGTYIPAPLTAHGGSDDSDTINVTARATSTDITCAGPTPANAPTTCTVVVTDVATTGTKTPPVGTVDFSVAPASATLLPDPCTLTPNAATVATDDSACTVQFTSDTIATYTISAQYVPAAVSVHATSSDTTTISVTARATSTTVTCPSPTPANSPVTCVVRVTDIETAGTGSPPQGTVDIELTKPDGAAATAAPDPCTLAPDATTTGNNDSTCNVEFSANTVGSYTIAATYDPLPASIHGSSSGSATVQVIARQTSTTVNCPATTPANTPASCVVRVTDTATGTRTPPEGSVDFTVAKPVSTAVATVVPDPCLLAPDVTTPAADDSTCTITFEADTVGSYTITGEYVPALISVHATSSGSDTIGVTARTTSTTLECPTTTQANVPVTCTATVSDTDSPTKSAPLGTVDFTFTSKPDGSTPTLEPDPCPLVPATATSSTCTVTFQSIRAGSYSISAKYEPAPLSVHDTSTGGDTITVTAGPAAVVTVDPPAASKVVNSQHCVTATVEDLFGNPKSGVKVFFKVVGVNSASGSRTTGIDGTTPQFCYIGRLFGGDVITAVADANGNNQPDATEPTGEAAVIWTLPPSTSFCEVDFVTYGVRIVAANGDDANAGGNVRVNDRGEPSGQHEYRDHGPAQAMNVHSINVLAVLCFDIDGVPGAKRAEIYGESTIDGGGRHNYRIDVEDRSEPGTNDKYWIVLDTGYDSGNQTITGGNVKIH